MSFRKRNIGLAGPSARTPNQSASPSSPKDTSTASIPGIRPSPLDGRPTTSTGTPSLDELLAGHAGLPLGNSLLVEENGTTDFAGALLRYYAAEGVVQGHIVHVVGVGEQWGRELPGLVGMAGEKVDKEAGARVDKEKMKIAWRYERLGEFGAGSRAPPSPARNPKAPTPGQPEEGIPTAFCHSFDLTKRLTLPTPSTINFIPIPTTAAPSLSPYTPILTSLTTALHTNKPHSIHRLIIPTILSPALYPPHACNPTHILPFLHSLRRLLRAHPTRLTAILTLPLALHPRTTGLVCWIEQLSDGVLELAPFPHSIDIEPPSSGASRNEEKSQGMVKVHKLPVLSEKGGGGGGGDDLAFSLSRRRFVIKPYSLPPVELDEEAQRGEAEGGKMKIDFDF